MAEKEREMRLKNIEMQGFKSFADKIYLDFNSGITAIVGPNGSGKSNISDAIRWVMGEQSIKSLRGSKMEDVIFSGTEERKALGFAEVTLTLDNTDGYFELDFPEITVTRRVYRSGEGEYFINKTNCRLKDIHELFMDTGLGRDGYSIIGQGKIDSILSTKSEDRRQIFEEAAGISKYKYRKTEAERKLVSTVENLTRVKDILSELELQIEPLEKQAEKAKKYLVLRDEMRGLDIGVSVINVNKIKDEVKKLEEDASVYKSQIDKISAELSETDKKVSEFYDKMREIDNRITANSNDEREVSNEITEIEKQVVILKNDIEHNIENTERLNEEIKSITVAVSDAEKELEVHKKELSELNKKLEINSEEGEKISAVISEADRSVSKQGDVLDEFKNKIIELTSELNNLRSYIENTKILKESFEKRRAEIEERLKDRQNDRESLKAQAETAEKEEKELKAKAEKLDVEFNKESEKLNEIREKLKKLNEEQSSTAVLLSQKKARRSMLEDMERAFEGYAKGVKAVMSAYKAGSLKKYKIYGPVAQLISTDKKYIIAIETALGGASQNIVTASEEDAKAAIEHLRERRLGRATFLPVAAISSRKIDLSAAKKQKGYISSAEDLVSCDEKYREIIGSLLGATVICDNIDNAVEMAKKCNRKFKIVTLNGDVILPGGAMTGGSNIKTAGSLSRTDEINSLTKEILKLEKAYESASVQFEKLKTEEESAEKRIFEKENERNRIQPLYLKAQAELEKIDALLKDFETADNRLFKEKDEISVHLSEIDESVKEKTAESERLIKERENAEGLATKAQEEFTRLSGENEKLAAKIGELNIKKAEYLKDIELENERIGALTDNKAQLLESVNVKKGGIETLKERNRGIEKEIEALNSKCDELKSKTEKYREDTESLHTERENIQEDVRKLQDSVKDTQEQKFALAQKATAIENRTERLETERESIINRIWEEYELTFSDAAEIKIPDGFDYKTASSKIKELKNKIKSLGNVNIDAIEEFKNVKERYDFLTVQTADLEKAKKELDSVIVEMMDKMQSKFSERFKIINQNFNRVFGELFGGGKANLYLTEPDNVLESGIEIEAQPPGKKLQSLTLLSGGERAFTAIAILFAILDVRPTPFCILDEIEAALDDVNVYRFADYLKKYSKKTQFIVVTHRRGTMESANILYGVTMQERGISKLLSLNIDEVKN